MTIYIYSLEGVHGVGKTSICSALKNKGFAVIDEGFMDEEDFGDYISSFSSSEKSHTFALELEWVGRMFKKICKLCSYQRKVGKVLKGNIIITDRTYITPLIYGALTSLGELGFLTVCKDIEKNIEQDFSVKFKNILLERPDLDGVFSHVISRLKEDPIREKLNEGEFNYLKSIKQEYDIRHKFFDQKIMLPEYGKMTSEKEAELVLDQLDPFQLAAED